MPPWAVALQDSIMSKFDALEAHMNLFRAEVTAVYNHQLSEATLSAFQYVIYFVELYLIHSAECAMIRVINGRATYGEHPLEPMPTPPVPPQVDIPAPGVAITSPPSGIPPPGPPPPGFPSTVREARELSYDELGALLTAFGLSSDGDAAERATRFALFVGYPA